MMQSVRDDLGLTLCTALWLLAVTTFARHQSTLTALVVLFISVLLALEIRDEHD